MAGFVELYIDQGTTFNSTIELTDDTTNAPINVALYSLSSQLRRSHISANASGNLVCTITDAANGGITLSMTAANTSNLKVGRHVFDVKSVDGLGSTKRLLEGMITVTPGITRT